jgi:hypothetical protein
MRASHYSSVQQRPPLRLSVRVLIPPEEPSLRSTIINLLNLKLLLLAPHSTPPLRPSLTLPNPYPASTVLIDSISAFACTCTQSSPLDAFHKPVKEQDTEERAKDGHDGGQEGDGGDLAA